MPKPDLAAVFKAAEARPKATAPAKPKTTNRTTKAKTSDKAPTQGYAARTGKKTLIAFVDPAAVRELKILAADTEMTQQSLFIEALNDLFVKHGRKPIA